MREICAVVAVVVSLAFILFIVFLGNHQDKEEDTGREGDGKRKDKE
jgi:hypothetical protein